MAQLVNSYDYIYIIIIIIITIIISGVRARTHTQW